MTAPEANQQYDLWVDRCRQQLERGAAGNALAAWMQSEGVSADLAATILEAARGQPAAASGQPAQGDPAAAAPPETAVQETPVQESTVPESTVPESTVPDTPVLQAEAAASLGADSAVPNRDGAAPDHTTVTTPAQPAPMPGNAAEVFAKAFGKPDKTAHGGTMATPPVPGQPDATPTMEPAPATGVQPVSPPQPPAQV